MKGTLCIPIDFCDHIAIHNSHTVVVLPYGGSAKEMRVHSHTPHNIIRSVSALEMTGEISAMDKFERGRLWHVCNKSRVR